MKVLSLLCLVAKITVYIGFPFNILHTSHSFVSALTTLEVGKLKPGPVEALEVRLATLRDGVVDIHTTEGAVERAQVNTPFNFSFYH